MAEINCIATISIVTSKQVYTIIGYYKLTTSEANL